MSSSFDPDLPRPNWRSRIVGHADVAPTELLLNPLNWRAHSRRQARVLSDLMSQLGWLQDVIVNRTTGRVVDGHLRVDLARKRGEPTVPVVFVELTAEEEALALATFDPVGALAAANHDVLTALLEQTTSDSAAVRELLTQIERAGTGAVPVSTADPDAVPAAMPDVVSRPGDLWVLGRHRVLDGDATSADAVARVLDGRNARFLWTDAPWGVEYEGRTKKRTGLRNHHTEALMRLLQSAFHAADTALDPGAPIYVVHPAGANAVTFGEAFLATGWHLHQTLVWLKDSFVPGHADYHYLHEEILYGWKDGRRPWFGGRKQASVFSIPRPRRSPEHPTQKPVELIEAHLRSSSRAGDLGLDPFLGSGSTLIAAERLGRICCGIEIESGFVDVTIRRWQAMTGMVAILASTGASFAAVEEARRGR